MLSAGFVLVGGQSRRMGQDKPLLPWRSGVLVEAVAAGVREVAGSATLVGPPQRYLHLGLPIIPDLRPGLGPLAAAHLRALIQRARKDHASCVVTLDGGEKLHPLCAVYHSRCLAVVSKALDEGRLRLTNLSSELNANMLRVPHSIPNVNTPEQWETLTVAAG